MPITQRILMTIMKKGETRGVTKRTKMSHAKVAVEVHIIIKGGLTNREDQSANLVSKITYRRSLLGIRNTIIITSKDDRAVTKHLIEWMIKIRCSQKRMTNISADEIMTELVAFNQRLRNHEKRQQCSQLRKESLL